MLARKIIVGFGISAIFPWLIYYGLSIAYPPPRLAPDYLAPLSQSATQEERQARAEEVKKRNLAHADAARNFARVLFSISTVLGVAAIIIGAHLASNAIGGGLILGGICSLALGYWGYSTYLDDWLRFVSLLAGFCALLFVGFRRLPST